MVRFLLVFGVLVVQCMTLCAAELPFPIGEELVYSVSYKGLPVASMTLRTQMDTVEGREVLAFRVRTETYAFFNAFFKVDDLHESLIDPKTLLPIRYTKNIKEGRYRCHEVTTFDFEKKKAHYEHQLNGKKKSYDITPDTRDLISFMYFMRSELLEENSTVSYRLMADEKLYDLILDSSGIDQVSLSSYNTKVPCIRVVPEAMFDGLFVRKGKATVWISRDSRRLMTFAKLKVPFGRVRVKLKSVSGPGEDFWITAKKDSEENHDD